MRAFPRERPVVATAFCALLAFSFPLFAFHQVVFSDRTLSTSLLVPGVNGSRPPPGARPPSVPGSDLYRLDSGASAWQTEPWVELTRRSQELGEWPLWNPYQAAGKPHAANTISAAFDPLLLVVNEHPSPLAWDLSILLAFCLGSVAMFEFLRSLALRRLACLAGSAVFSLGGFFALYSNNLFARGYIFLPILLLLVDRVLLSTSPPWTVGLGVAFAAAVLVGIPEASLLVVGTAVLYALYRLFTACERTARSRAVGRLALAAVLGVALASPLLVLFAQYLGLSFNTHQSGSAQGAKSLPIADLFSWAVPFLNGRPLYAHSIFGSGTRDWVGAGALAAVVLCVAAPFRFLAARAAPFFAALALLAVWKIYDLPGSSAVGKLPGLELVNYSTFLLPVLQFALAALAAIGIDAMLRGQISRRRLVGVTAVLVVGGALALWRSPRDPGDETVLWAGIAAIATATVLGVAWVLVVRPGWRLRAGIVAALVIIIEMFVLFPKQIYEHRVDPYQAPRWQTIIEAAQPAGPKVDRVFGLDGKLFPDTATALGLYDIRANDALYVDRYIDYVREFVSPAVFDRFTGVPLFHGEQLPIYSENPMFDLFGVKHVLANGTQRTDPASLIEYADTAPGAPDLFRGPVTVGADKRDAAVVFDGGEFTAPLPTRAAAARLEASYAVLPSTPGQSPEEPPVTFVIEGIAADGSRVPLFRDQQSPEPAQTWHDATIDLGAVTTPITSVTFWVENLGSGVAAWSDAHYVDREGRELGPQYRRIGTTGGADVYENLHAVPRAFVAHDVTSVRSQQAALRFLRSRGRPAQGGTLVDRFDPRAQAVVETKRGDEPSAPCQGRADDRAVITEYRPLEVRVRVDAACAGLLVLSDTYYPDWEATVDGRDVAVLPTDALFRGVRVPAGRSMVIFRYESHRFELALWVARLATLAAIVWIVMWAVPGFQRFLRRRNRSAHRSNRLAPASENRRRRFRPS